MADFITKDSGKRQQYKSGMQRDLQDGKPRYDLVIPLGTKEPMLKRWAELLQRGMDKYGYRNWEKANSLDIYLIVRKGGVEPPRLCF